MKYVAWFSEIKKEDVGLVGGKGANLGEMYNIGLPIPPGFCVTSKGYDFFMQKTGISNGIKKILDGLDINDTDELEKRAEEIQELILNSVMPEELGKEIEEAYNHLDVNIDLFKVVNKSTLSMIKAGRSLPYVAVRSSATAEDLPEASFAGQQETYLNVKGAKNVVASVVKCISSLFKARAIYYREKNHFDHMKVKLSAVVQKMINSEKSGVMFSANPSTNNRDEIMIEAGFGLGEAIVLGQINPDNYIVDKNTFEIKNILVKEKTILITRDENLGRTVKKKLPQSKWKEQVLKTEEIIGLAKYGAKIDEHYGKPMDMEFAIDGGKIFIVQARPITTLKEEFKEEKMGTMGYGQRPESEDGVILRGLPASRGIASGKVKIITGMHDLSKVLKGDVLVANMTNPDYVMAMQRACAIVTDEGGSTCFAGDTNVLTTKGFKNIKDVCESVCSGENVVVLSYDSKEMKPAWKRVISAGKRKNNTIKVSVSQTGRIEDNSIELTPDHKMITFKDRDFVKKRIDRMLEEDEGICLLDSLPLMSKRNDNKLAYLMGALLSDGHIKVDMHHTGNPRRGKVVFTQKDVPEKKEFVETVKTYFEECFDESFNSTRLKEGSSCLRGRIIHGTAMDYMCHRLKPALAISKISQNLDMWVMGLDESSCLNFLAGLIDGDGCFCDNRLHIYVLKENVLQGIVLACLNLGIFPQITRNRGINHVQILERMPDILNCTKRVKGTTTEKILGNKLFSAKQIFGDIIEEVNFKGRVKPYVNKNLLIDSRKIEKNILGMASEEHKLKLLKILQSGLRMQRIQKIYDSCEKVDVYNLEVEADNEMNHNFVAFTKKYTPLLVSNSHAAIVSREMGIPCVVGTEKATKILKDGDEITVDGAKGFVWRGIKTEMLQSAATEVKHVHVDYDTITKVKVICDLPDRADVAAATEADGVGLVRIEFMIAENGVHPIWYVRENREEEYTDMLYKGLSRIADAFKGKPIWIRTSDIRSDEYRNLKGGDLIDDESNPMIGWHGIRFALDESKVLEAEFRAVKRLHDNGYKDVGVMIPFVISLEEVKKAKEIMRSVGLEPVKDVSFGVMVETPAAVWIIDDLCREGMSFISFGTNDLTQTTLGVDRNNERIQKSYDEMHPAVLREIEHVIEVCKKNGVETSICGQAGSKEKMVEFLVKKGIDSISANLDAVDEVRSVVSRVEKRLILDSARKR